MVMEICTFPSTPEKCSFILYFLKTWGGGTYFLYSALPPGELCEEDGYGYSTVSAGCADKKCSYLIAVVEIKLSLDKF